MSSHHLEEIGPAFVEMAHKIAWATVATVDIQNRPRTRVLHPLWEFTDGVLSGIIATGPTPTKRADLDHSPYLSCGYWIPEQDVCRADCEVEWATDDETCEQAWQAFKDAPRPMAMTPPSFQTGPMAQLQMLSPFSSSHPFDFVSSPVRS